MIERCHRCDRPKPTKQEWELVNRGLSLRLDDKCWAPDAGCEPIDWRARCLAAEAAMLEVVQQSGGVAMRLNATRLWMLGGGRYPDHADDGGPAPAGPWVCPTCKDPECGRTS